jgi:hypothetical protein
MFYYVIHHYTLLLCQISIISLHVINLPFPYKAIDVNTKVKCFKIFLRAHYLTISRQQQKMKMATSLNTHPSPESTPPWIAP